MLFRNLASVLGVYLIFLVIAYFVLSVGKMHVFVTLAILGVAWALTDAVELAGVENERSQHVAFLGGCIAAAAMSALAMVIPYFF